MTELESLSRMSFFEKRRWYCAMTMEFRELIRWRWADGTDGWIAVS